MPQSRARREAEPDGPADAVAELADELGQAVRWNRPSILLVVSESEKARRAAQLELRERLQAAGQKVQEIAPEGEGNVDLPLRLGRKRNRGTTVYFIKRLAAGGEEALRALNIRREYLVEKAIRVVFWIDRGEERAIAHAAPDFWAFRHRVIYLGPVRKLDNQS